MHDIVAERVDSNYAERPAAGSTAGTRTDPTAPRENRRLRSE
jgi:hypothetical protein